MHRRLLCLVYVAFVWSALLSPAWAAHSREDAVALVRRAAEFVHSHDRTTALAAFNDPDGQFRDGDLYLFVMDTDEHTLVAHGGNPGMVGVTDTIVDADGADFTGQAMALVDAQGEGWIDYKWPYPTTKKIAAKSAFLLRVGALILCAGVYQ